MRSSIGQVLHDGGFLFPDTVLGIAKNRCQHKANALDGIGKDILAHVHGCMEWVHTNQCRSGAVEQDDRDLTQKSGTLCVKQIDLQVNRWQMTIFIHRAS